MASDGSHGPRPFKQRQARTIFVRVPAGDWSAVTRGSKTEFRASPKAAPQLWSVEPPTLVVAYRTRPNRPHEAKLMVLEETWREPLGAITAESLEREGFPDMAHFRRYWMQREKRRFALTRMVQVFRVRPVRAGDEEAMGLALIERLYGDWL